MLFLFAETMCRMGVGTAVWLAQVTEQILETIYRDKISNANGS